MTAKRSFITISDCRIMEHEPERQCLARRWGPRPESNGTGQGPSYFPNGNPNTPLRCPAVQSPPTFTNKQLEQLWP